MYSIVQKQTATGKRQQTKGGELSARLLVLVSDRLLLRLPTQKRTYTANVWQVPGGQNCRVPLWPLYCTKVTFRTQQLFTSEAKLQVSEHIRKSLILKRHGEALQRSQSHLGKSEVSGI